MEKLEEKIPDMLKKIYEANSDKMSAVPQYLGVQQLGASSVVLRFVVEVKEADLFSTGRIMNRALFLGFRKLGVECPFQQIDIHNKLS